MTDISGVDPAFDIIRLMKRSATFHAAISYAQAGYSVFPCKEKKPITPNGFKDATRDEKQIYDWWSEAPEAQLALPTGEQNGLLVLDVDNAEATDYVKKLNLPKTKTIQTRKGRWQLWFKQPKGTKTKCSAGVLAPGVDVRGDGGYVVAPPSVHHESGEPYKVVADVPIAELTASFLELIKDNRQEVPASTNGNGLTPGSRRPKLFKIACSLRKQGLDVPAIYEALKAIPCNPPLPESEIRKLAEGSTRYDEQPPIQEASAAVELECCANIKPEKVQWLWAGRIAIGKLNMFVGDPEKGKSLVSLDLAARISTGTPFPDGSPCERGDVVILSAEDAASDTVVPRLMEADADLKRIHIVKAVKVTLPDGQKGESFIDLTRDLARLEEALKKLPNVKLVLIDPLTAYLGKVDTHKDAEVRAALAPVAELADRNKLAILSIMHLRKSEAAALLRVSGAVAFVAAARAVWAFGLHPDDPDQRIMVAVKNNLASRAPSLVYKFAVREGQEAAHIEWLSTKVTFTADEVLDNSPKTKRDYGVMQDRARDWLGKLLESGPMPQREIEAQAEKAGIAERTLRRAKDDLSIASRRKGSAWLWLLPSGQDVQSGAR